MDKNSKQLQIDQVRAKVKDLYEANNDVIISSPLLTEILGFRCKTYVGELVQEKILVFIGERSSGKTRFYAYKVNPDANWSGKRFSKLEWEAEKARNEEAKSKIGKRMFDILFGPSWVTFNKIQN